MACYLLTKMDKNDFINLLSGTHPPYKLFEHELVKKYYEYNGSTGSGEWNRYKIEADLNSEQIYNLYELIKNNK